MFRIGCHISSAGGYLAMAKRAEALGANTFAFFTRNPRGGSAKPIEEADIAAFHAECARAGIDRLVAHAPYTLNPCAAKPNVAEFARMAFSDDLQRMEHTPGQFYNFHPGSHVGQGIDAGIEKIAALLNVGEELLDYVVIHELAHRRHMNHSADFWAEVEKYCPDYKVQRKRLKEYKLV